ncbi:MAG: hypothetical protein ACRBDI_07060 [Alphaproteobacteria bacterium]
MQNIGNKILEVSRGSAFKWARIILLPCFIGLMILCLLQMNMSIYGQVIISLCIFLFIFCLAEELLLNRSQILVTVYENGIDSECLKYSGSRFIPWTDIKEIELVKGWFQYRRCYYLWLKPHDTLKCNYKIPWMVLCSRNRTHELGFNALSVNISLGLDIDPHYFYTVCEDARKNQ